MNVFSKLSLRARLTLFFVVMSVIPAAVLGAAALRLFSDNLEANETRSNQHTLEFLDYRLEQVISDIHQAVLLTAYDTNVRSYFHPAATADADTLAAIGQMARRQLISLQQREDADSVMLVSTEDGRALVYSKVNFARVSEVDEVDYQLQDASRFRIHAAWGTPRTIEGKIVLPYERIVMGLDNTTDVARLVVNYPESVFSNLFKRYEAENHAGFYVINQQGTILSGTDETAIGHDASDEFGVDITSLKGATGSFHARGYLCSFLNNVSNQYILLERMPLSVFTTVFRPVASLMLGISVICVFVCFALGALQSHSMTKPLYALLDRVSTDPTSATHASTTRHKDEFAVLSSQYDEVLQRLEGSIADYYEEQRKKREAEVRALEFQINPHFLYNTLSTIIWLIDAGESDHAIEITRDLSEFFRISISKGREFISMREELRHVQLYVDIQKSRYADLITVQYEVPEELLSYLIPKLILQPLVENSIIHGMRDNHGGCHIRICGSLEDTDIILTVEDDGDRATEHTIDEMNRFLEQREGPRTGEDYGIGIANVHDRIRMSFGDGYGLRYIRREGCTIALLRIRVTERGEENVPHIDR